MRVSLTQAFTEVPGRSYRRAAPPFLAGGVLSPAQMHRGGSHSRTLRDQPPLVTFQLLGENAPHACVLCFHLPVSVVSSEFRFSLLGFPSPPHLPPPPPTRALGSNWNPLAWLDVTSPSSLSPWHCLDLPQLTHSPS